MDTRLKYVNYHVQTADGEDVVCPTHAIELMHYPDFVPCDTDWCQCCYVCEGRKVNYPEVKE